MSASSAAFAASKRLYAAYSARKLFMRGKPRTRSCAVLMKCPVASETMRCRWASLLPEARPITSGTSADVIATTPRGTLCARSMATEPTSDTTSVTIVKIFSR